MSEDTIPQKSRQNRRQVEIIDSPVPSPVVIKVVVSGSNPKDWSETPLRTEKSSNTGDDIAGIVHAVELNVYEFKPGDRVAAFHEMRTPGGSFAEYAVAWQHTTSHVPKNLSFKEAATIPLAALTAVIGNYVHLSLPEPWHPAPSGEKLPFLVYGAASAVGAYAIKFARLSNIHPIIAVAGKGILYVETLLDKSQGDAVIDYRAGIKAALQNSGSHANIVAVLAPDALVTNVLPIKRNAPPGFAYPSIYLATAWSMVGDVHGPQKEIGFAYFRWIFGKIAQGEFRSHPHEVMPGDWRGLRDGKASAVKYIFRIGDTEGAGKD
ncbi:chaperonin 10-like protein [Mycena albidolilacea]|uniref:Chaperonin 10-like protein n=1 Tax=Mycena albidolilacea TaxID=1033008 RepID=A0AAD7ABF4_9AGAR|nr:chaperonin 10-like protein [Mycena albidolilacea]